MSDIFEGPRDGWNSKRSRYGEVNSVVGPKQINYVEWDVEWSSETRTSSVYGRHGGSDPQQAPRDNDEETSSRPDPSVGPKDESDGAMGGGRFGVGPLFPHRLDSPMSRKIWCLRIVTFLRITNSGREVISLVVPHLLIVLVLKHVGD